MSSLFGQNIDKSNVKGEYPRPYLVRDSFLNLNGLWNYSINKDKASYTWQGEILVPFSPETPLSGVDCIVTPNDVLTYERKFDLPDGFKKKRVILHFEAVDQECEVILNNQKIGAHVGGYFAFEIDVTDEIKDKYNELIVICRDYTEEKPHARGKQKLVRKGKYASIFYTPQSGIWKSVWLESTEDEYICDVRCTPYLDDENVNVDIKVNSDGAKGLIQIFEGTKEIASKIFEKNGSYKIKINNPHLWSPEDPFLYDVKVTYGNDSVGSYFGMRKYSIGKDKNGIMRFFLNNKPFFFNGVLDQGYWPESLLTPPSEEALVYDIERISELGYNTIRKHVKIEDASFYHECDKRGMIVWQDMPNGGGEYNMGIVTYLPNYLPWCSRDMKDHHYMLLGRQNKWGREQYEVDIKRLINQLGHYTCIATWVPFNEGWGQFDAKRISSFVREMDDTRLINEACGWFDQKGGDMYSIHNYVRDLKVRPRPPRVVALTEYGGYAYPVEGHLYTQKKFGYKYYESSEELTKNYEALWERDIFPNVAKGLGSAIYTQVSDVEEEINGIMTYDRQVVKFEKTKIKALNKKLYDLFEQITTE